MALKHARFHANRFRHSLGQGQLNTIASVILGHPVQ